MLGYFFVLKEVFSSTVGMLPPCHVRVYVDEGEFTKMAFCKSLSKTGAGVRPSQLIKEVKIFPVFGFLLVLLTPFSHYQKVIYVSISCSVFRTITDKRKPLPTKILLLLLKIDEFSE